MAHTHYKGTGKIHSFRGLLADGGQDKIGIQGSVGATAWRINKFEIISEKPGAVTQESVVKIYREEQTAVDGEINFNDNELLASGTYFASDNTSQVWSTSSVIVFDNTLFVRNIWATHSDLSTGQACNYYIELEEVKVSKAGMAQLSLAASRRVQSDV